MKSNTEDNKIQILRKEATLNEIVDDYKRLNHLLSSIIDRFNNIFECKNVTDDDIHFFETYKAAYQPFALDLISESVHGNGILFTTIESSFEEVFRKAYLYPYDPKSLISEGMVEEFKKNIISIGKNTEFILDEHQRLVYWLYILQLDYNNLAETHKGAKKSQLFHFPSLAYKAMDEHDLYKRKEIFDNAYFHSEMYMLNQQLSEDDKKKQYDYSQNCHRAAKLVTFLIEQEQSQANKSEQEKADNIVPSKFRLAPKRKTDFLKILSAMYDCRMFETEDGYIANNKQELISEFGRLLGEDFKKYSVSLSQSKQVTKETFLKPFTDIRKKAEEYYDK